MVTPSELLVRAADLIRDTPEPWVSPAVAPMIEKWLRDTASFFDEFADYWVTIPEQARDALALARAVLGEKEEQ